MVELTHEEARVLGVLIEKALTTPEQYPLSLNAMTAGCNQKNNRDPVLNLTEDQVFDAVESLRAKQLTIKVDNVGQRVHKYRHCATETLHARTAELAILAELLLRGPQTMGELRGRASRMAPFETLDRVRDMLRALSDRPEPLIKEIAPSPGSRAERYMQLLSPDLHPIGAVTSTQTIEDQPIALSTNNQRLEKLEKDMATLMAAVKSIAEALGIPDPTNRSEQTDTATR